MTYFSTVQIDIKSEVAEKLGYYVYLYIDPRTGKTFYVGKGTAGTKPIAGTANESDMPEITNRRLIHRVYTFRSVSYIESIPAFTVKKIFLLRQLRLVRR